MRVIGRSLSAFCAILKEPLTLEFFTQQALPFNLFHFLTSNAHVILMHNDTPHGNCSVLVLDRFCSVPTSNTVWDSPPLMLNMLV
jgi:hypothetical protein